MTIVARLRSRWRAWTLFVSAVLALLVTFSGAGTSLERFLRERAWNLRSHSASGALHIVEIDARSIASIDRWPWPRGNHAQVIDRLRAAGAASIAFDVDFSSQSQPGQDAALAAALERAGGKVVLPTFRQAAGGGKQGWTDSLPTPALRDRSTLAAVSILPDDDGYVRRLPIGTVTAGVPRPSLAAMLADADGAANRDFPIDFAIAPASIPRHSFIDIRDGRFDPATIRGKHVVIGATAVEMGDRYAVPNHGVIPGAVIQALGAETLARGMPREGGWPIPLALGLGCGWALLRLRSRRALAAGIAWTPLLIFFAAVAADALAQWIFPVVPALAAFAGVAAAAVAMRVSAALHRRRAHDAATGLPNRVALLEAMGAASAAGVVAARILGFDKLAAGLGTAGTAALVLRVSDRIALLAGGVVVHRIEDRVLAWRVDGDEELEARFETLRVAMLSPVEVGGRRVDVTLAYGFAPENGSAHDHVLANATLAANQAREEGRGWHLHDAGEGEAIDRELSLLGELDEAVERGEIQVVYQPKLDLRTGAIVSVEALVRWQHPVRGFLRPDLFIPLAERSDRIAGLTLHVVARTIADLRRWHAAGFAISGAVNLSAKLLSARDFLRSLDAVIETGGIAPQKLTLEITESAAMHDPEGAVAALAAFRAQGIGISMDDYGTGQSTLSYIKQLPLDELKIDRSFVQFAHQNRGDAVLVRSTVNLAHELGLKVVAEGVEDQECLDFLRAIGCDLAQGYLISKPIDADALLALLRKGVAEAA